MTATYDSIATVTLGSATANIDFNSIPASFTDLRVVIVGTAVNAGSVGFRFNNQGGSGYSRTFMFGNGSNPSSGRNTDAGSIIGPNINSGFPSFITIDIFSYAGSTDKTVLFEGSDDRNGSGTVSRGIGVFRDSTPISSVNIFENNGFNFNAGTTVSLYGIKAE